MQNADGKDQGERIEENNLIGESDDRDAQCIVSSIYPCLPRLLDHSIHNTFTFFQNISCLFKAL